MTPGPDADALHLELILERIARIRDGLEGLDYASFSANPDKIDATTYRLSNIGESSRKLSPQIKQRHAGIPW